MRQRVRIAVAGLCGAAAVFALATALSLHPVDPALRGIAAGAQTVQITDRNGRPLTASYQNRWNSYDAVPIYAVPDFLKSAFIASEDRRYFEHRGVDWSARFAAMAQDIVALRRVRGASTISEQVVRMIDPRPRNLWSKWLEGLEAMRLERDTAKTDVFEFYLNQIPYAANRRGVVQAARYYFGRDLSTLSQKEMLALVVLARSPSGYDPRRHPDALGAAIDRLTASMAAQGTLKPADKIRLAQEGIHTVAIPDEVDAGAFIHYVRLNAPPALTAHAAQLRTTLDARLQQQVQAILDERLLVLRKRNAHNAAAIVVDHQTGEILAWVVAANGSRNDLIDAVLTPRQPGSALKPFLYAAALDRGWTSATIIDDSPMAEAVGTGLHRFRNYSNVYYGPITLREALGNSLNIPAVRTIGHVGVGPYLSLLHAAGFASLDQGSGIYDEGLALGDGAVTLFEMAQGYAALAHQGIYSPLRAIEDEEAPQQRRIWSPEAATLIGNILSDPWARMLEFGKDSVLDLPVQTAAKTGTSTDYRDAWTMGFDDRYVVGLWMGNLDGTPMDGVTGSTGPALAFRSVFALLEAGRQTAPLPLSPRLAQADVCIRPVPLGQNCPRRTEWFAPGTVPAQSAPPSARRPIELVRPTDGLQMAVDPRVPVSHQKFRFELAGLRPGDGIEWHLDDRLLARTAEGTYLWPLERGAHLLWVSVDHSDNTNERLRQVGFIVK